eukprot:5435743-Alexandrium_andersonii.AAC.1
MTAPRLLQTAASSSSSCSTPCPYRLGAARAWALARRRPRIAQGADWAYRPSSRVSGGEQS